MMNLKIEIFYSLFEKRSAKIEITAKMFLFTIRLFPLFTWDGKN
jgi:hypothetical protein